jgi:hypothetical protein
MNISLSEAPRSENLTEWKCFPLSSGKRTGQNYETGPQVHRPKPLPLL